MLVDYPKQLPGASLAEERASGARPYFALIGVENTLGVSTEGRASNIRMARLYEETSVPDGEFGERLLKRIRVLFPGGFALYEMGEKEEYVLVEEGPMTPLTRVPLVPVYGRKAGPWIGLPPLLDLAYKNIQHYQLDWTWTTPSGWPASPCWPSRGWNADQDPTIKVGPNLVLAPHDPDRQGSTTWRIRARHGAGRQRLETSRPRWPPWACR